MDESEDLLNINDLLESANKMQIDVWGREGAEPITERTFRYWVGQGLIPRRATRGPSSKYPKSLIIRLLFIRLLQTKEALSLNNIKTTIMGKYRRAAPGPRQRRNTGRTT